MCTSFVFRKEDVWIGMNFDNNETDFRISTNEGNDFLVSVKVDKRYFPTIGINRNGVFVNDQRVGANEKGKYKRQTDKRWVTTKLIQFTMEGDRRFEGIMEELERVEIVNVPKISTHNLIVDPGGDLCLVEPGRRNIFSEKSDTEWYVVSNFPLSDYEEVVPAAVMGTGADRYLKVLEGLSALRGPMTVERGFEILKSVQQDGPDWTTELSIIYNATGRRLFYCLNRDYDKVFEYGFDLQEAIIWTR